MGNFKEFAPKTQQRHPISPEATVSLMNSGGDEGSQSLAKRVPHFCERCTVWWKSVVLQKVYRKLQLLSTGAALLGEACIAELESGLEIVPHCSGIFLEVAASNMSVGRREGTGVGWRC